MRSLRELLIVEAQDLHAGETLLAEALPRIVESARSESLQRALGAQHTDAERQVERLERVLASLGAGPSDDDCEAMEGIVAQAEELMEDDLPGEILDAALLVTALKVKHFEIASYRSLVALADACGARDAATLLRASLAEERQAEVALDHIAAREIHRKAALLAPAEHRA